MNVYQTEFRSGNGVRHNKSVFAKDAGSAIESFLRWADKNYYSGVEVETVTLLHKVDVFYKTAKK